MKRKYTDLEFELLIQHSHSFREALQKMGLKEGGANLNTIKTRISRLGISTNHFRGGNTRRKPAIPLEEALKVSHKSLSSNHKKQLLESGLIGEKCAECGIGETWNGKPITLQIDHINGNRYDHRLENLRLLCPNCHSQTETWGRRNGSLPPNLCLDCDKKILRRSKRCHTCANKLIASRRRQKTKINWDEIDLEKLVWEKPMTQLAKQLGVSDVAVKKRCKRLGIETPPRGYFLRSQKVKSK